MQEMALLGFTDSWSPQDIWKVSDQVAVKHSGISGNTPMTLRNDLGMLRNVLGIVQCPECICNVLIS